MAHSGEKEVIILVNFLLNAGVRTWSTGVTAASCKSMYPIHGEGPQDEASPYSLIPEKMKIFSNESVVVSLEGDWFKGFMVVAKPTGTWQMRWQNPIGIWRNGYGLHTFECFLEKYSAISHEHSQYFDSMELEWTPPRNFEGRVTFVASVVKRYKEFWTWIYSKPVKVIKAN